MLCFGSSIQKDSILCIVSYLLDVTIQPLNKWMQVDNWTTGNWKRHGN